MSAAVQARRPPWTHRALVRVRRGLRLGVQAAGRGVVEFTRSDNLTYAASIAYYSLLSMFPFLLLVLVGLRTLALGTAGAALGDLIEAAMPANLAPIVGLIQQFDAPPAVSVFGVVIMLWAAMGVFGAVTSAVNHAWGVDQPPGFFRHKLIAFVMLMAAGALMAVALVLVTAVRIADATWFNEVLDSYPALVGLRGFVYRNAVTPLSILVAGLIYYYVPNARVRLRDVWVGAILAGLLWRLAFDGFSMFMSDFSRYSLEGSVPSIMVFLVWVYLSAVILLYGVEVTATYARLRKHLAPTAPAAAVREAQGSEGPRVRRSEGPKVRGTI